MEGFGKEFFAPRSAASVRLRFSNILRRSFVVLHYSISSRTARALTEHQICSRPGERSGARILVRNRAFRSCCLNWIRPPDPHTLAGDVPATVN